MTHQFRGFVDELSKIAEKDKKREELTPVLGRALDDIERSIYELDVIVKRSQNHVFTKDDLLYLLFAWRKAAQYINIKEIRLDICGRGYDMYGATVFKNIQELEEQINNWSDVSIINNILKRDRHDMNIVMN